MSDSCFLSYNLSPNTPTYREANKVSISRNRSIEAGDCANDSTISMTVHSGTHVDLPCHFYADGQTIEDYPCSFWTCNSPAIVEVDPRGKVISEELISVLKNAKNVNRMTDILLIKTGLCYDRELRSYAHEGYGISKDVAFYIRENLPSVKMIGFDSISVASPENRAEGRLSHRAFLDPKKPILLIEDMDLREIDATVNFTSIVVAPLRILQCDGLPCSVIAYR